MENKRNEVIKDVKDLLKIGVGGVAVGGVIKEDWLNNNIFVWVSLLLMITFIFLLNKKIE